jgi:hypothetical protein
MDKLENYSTEELVNELKQRDGIKVMTTEPNDSYSISTENFGINAKGSATILIITV